MFQLAPLPRTLQAAGRDRHHQSAAVRESVARDLARDGADGEGRTRTNWLVEMLSDPAPAVRRRALLSLADRGAREAADAVTDLLADAEPGVREFALVALGELGGDRHGEAARPFLDAPEPALRFQALQAWARLRPTELRGPLLGGFDDADPALRRLALRLLEEWLLDAPGAVLDGEIRARVERLAADPDPTVRSLAQLTGGELGLDVPSAAVVALVNGRARGGEPRDEQRAIEFCGRRRLESARPGLRRRAFGLWGVSFDPFRYQALAGLAALGDERARVRLAGLLERGRPHERALAVFAVGRVELTELRGALERLRSEPARVDAEVLREALAALDAADEDGRSARA